MYGYLNFLKLDVLKLNNNYLTGPGKIIVIVNLIL